jgi:hypothetical protein
VEDRCGGGDDSGMRPARVVVLGTPLLIGESQDAKIGLRRCNMLDPLAPLGVGPREEEDLRSRRRRRSQKMKRPMMIVPTREMITAKAIKSELVRFCLLRSSRLSVSAVAEITSDIVLVLSM